MQQSGSMIWRSIIPTDPDMTSVNRCEKAAASGRMRMLAIKNCIFFLLKLLVFCDIISTVRVFTLRSDFFVHSERNVLALLRFNVLKLTSKARLSVLTNIQHNIL